MTTKTYRVLVTAENIRRGNPAFCHKCAVAIAIRETVPNVRAVAAYSNSLFIYTRDGESIEMTTPAVAAQFIKAACSGVSVKPFTFELSIP